MPLYDETCDTCGRSVEVLKKPGEPHVAWRCPVCGGTMRRGFPAPSLPPDGRYSWRP